MAEPDIKDLCDKNRFPKKGWQIFTLLLYSPVGLALAVVRVFIAIQALIAAIILPEMSLARSIILRMICGVLGIVVDEKNTSVRDRSTQVIVANHITQLDFLAAHLATGCITWDLPSPLAWALGIKYMGRGRYPDINKLRAHLEKSPSPIFLQPEEASTSGKVGLLKFSHWMAKISDNVQPVTIKTTRPSFGDVTCDVLGSSFISELFWFLFCPSTLFTLRYLPVIQKEADETEEKFTERVEQAIAADLGIPSTSYTAADKAEYEKRYLIEYNQPVLITSSGQTALPCAELQQMASQVKEVLPHVPVNAILQDLGRTHSVDLTISNILEGSVHFTPVQHQQPVRVDPVPSSTVQMKNQPVLQSLSQGQGKMISFMERKAKLIADARRRPHYQ
ncbi:lipid droplet-regulating VLDL assembly factor AUP1-like isoform X2 [Lycorma delicatula]|uniref:lipid droplet-regulating VLDL assembly factor AUP1-like isoform X2 n=1 Tax=Lycorma delicatula TaxID=130591 RepID=UPI003F51944D